MLNKLIGIPYKYPGSDFDGCDCWGVVKLYYKTILNKDIPNVSLLFTKEKIETFKPLMTELCKMPPFDCFENIPRNEITVSDILVFDRGPFGAHCAVYLGQDKMLHVYEAVQGINGNDYEIGSHIVSASSGGHWKKKIVACWRLKSI